MRQLTFISAVAGALLSMQGFAVWEALEGMGLVAASDMMYTWAGCMGYAFQFAILTGMVRHYHWKRNPSWPWCKAHLMLTWLHYYALLDVAQMAVSLGDFWQYKHLAVEAGCAAVSGLYILLVALPRLKKKHVESEEKRRRNDGHYIM